jgi:hypothetical protein
MSWQAALSLGIPALVAVVGFLITYRNSLALSRRKDRLDRVGRQLGELYGPLFAMSSASAETWRVFRSEYRPGGGFWGKEGPPPTTEEAAAWRLWITTVFMPLNRRMRDVIVDHADLLDEERIPDLLLRVCAHVAVYEAILKQWEQGNHARHATPINFPSNELVKYSEERVQYLKKEQNRLLRQTTSGSR